VFALVAYLSQKGSPQSGFTSGGVGTPNHIPMTTGRQRNQAIEEKPPNLQKAHTKQELKVKKTTGFIQSIYFNCPQAQ